VGNRFLAETPQLDSASFTNISVTALGAWCLYKSGVRLVDLGGLNVRSLGHSALAKCAQLQAIVATSPCSLGVVGACFVAETPQLESISFVKISISALGAAALFDSGIRKINFGGLHAASVGCWALEYCSRLRTVTATSASSLGGVGDFFLARTSQLERMAFENMSIRAIGVSALFQSGVRQLDLGGLMVTSLGAHAFESCANLTFVTATSPCSLGTVGDHFLAETPQLASMSFDNISVTVLGSSALFQSGIRHLDLGGLRIRRVGDRCFEGCSKLTTVTASSPCSLGVVGDHFLSGTPMLTSVCSDNITVATIEGGSKLCAATQLRA
jgi:hypothetical protein